MARHIITAAEVEEYLSKESWDQVAASFGSGSSKKLEYCAKHKLYRVTNRGSVAYIGRELNTAVSLYNERP